MPHTDRFIPISLLIVAMLIFVSGCMSPLDTDPYRPWLDQDPATWATPAGGSRHQADTLRNASLEQDAEASVQIDANADADVYARIALRHNPSILAVERRIKRLGARVPQVTSLSDPMFMIAPFGQMAETAAGEVGIGGVDERAVRRSRHDDQHQPEVSVPWQTFDTRTDCRSRRCHSRCRPPACSSSSRCGHATGLLDVLLCKQGYRDNT